MRLAGSKNLAAISAFPSAMVANRTSTVLLATIWIA